MQQPEAGLLFTLEHKQPLPVALAFFDVGRDQLQEFVGELDDLACAETVGAELLVEGTREDASRTTPVRTILVGAVADVSGIASAHVLFLRSFCAAISPL